MSALSDLRRARRTRRLGDTEWFDLAYRVYLAAFFGGSAIIILSDQVGDGQLSADRVADIAERGPTWIGVLIAAVVAAALRGGTHGGPVTVESADVHHLLLAPVSRASVLRLPLWQRIRTMAFGGALVGGVGGLLAEQRIPSSAGWWVWWGAVAGFALGAALVCVATIAHALSMPGWLATVLGLVLVGWQTWAAATGRTGPADSLGGLPLRDLEPEPGQLAALVVVVALVATAHALVGRLRPEHLVRRGLLVSQLHFAVTMQDLRTVVLLRRQLGQEYTRPHPWLRPPVVGRGPAAAVARRSVVGLTRMPLQRLGRMVVVAGLAGAAAGAATRGTTPAFLLCGVLLFVLGLDLIEPLSQEIDHPDRTADLPRPDGWLHGWLLTGPLAASVPLAVVGAGACTVVAPEAAPAAFALAVPVMWCGLIGAVVNAVRDQFDPTSPAARTTDLVVPPEVAGVRDVTRLLWPVVVSCAGVVAALVVRARPDAGMVLRATAGMALWLAGAGWWIVHRQALRLRWRRFAAGAA